MESDSTDCLLDMEILKHLIFVLTQPSVSLIVLERESEHITLQKGKQS